MIIITTINYEYHKWINEEHSFEVEDTKNCFIEGHNDKNQPEWFGVYTSAEGRLNIMTLGYDKILVQSWSNSGYTEGWIREFLKDHKRNKVISFDEFKYHFDMIRNKLAIFDYEKITIPLNEKKQQDLELEKE